MNSSPQNSLWGVFDRFTLKLLKLKRHLEIETPIFNDCAGTISELCENQNSLILQAGRLRAILGQLDELEKAKSTKDIVIEVRRNCASRLAESISSAKTLAVRIRDIEIDSLNEVSACKRIVKMPACEGSIGLDQKIDELYDDWRDEDSGDWKNLLSEFNRIAGENTGEHFDDGSPLNRLSESFSNLIEKTKLNLANTEPFGIPDILRQQKSLISGRAKKITDLHNSALQPSAVRIDALLGTGRLTTELEAVVDNFDKFQKNDDLLDFSFCADKIAKLDDRWNRILDKVPDKNKLISKDIERTREKILNLERRTKNENLFDFKIINSIDSILKDARTFIH